MNSNWAVANLLIQEKLVYVHDFTQDTPSDSQGCESSRYNKQNRADSWAGWQRRYLCFFRGQWGAERGVRKAIPKTECKKGYISIVLKLIRTFWSYSIWRLPCHNGCFRNNLAHDSDCRFVLLCFHFTFTFICFTFSTSYQNILDRFHFHLILALILRVFSFTGCVTFSLLGRMVMFNFINKTRDLKCFWRCVTWGRDWAKKSARFGHSAQRAVIS